MTLDDYIASRPSVKRQQLEAIREDVAYVSRRERKLAFVKLEKCVFKQKRAYGEGIVSAPRIILDTSRQRALRLGRYIASADHSLKSCPFSMKGLTHEGRARKT
eukprot:767881-Amphidinium_carterae.1